MMYPKKKVKEQHKKIKYMDFIYFEESWNIETTNNISQSIEIKK